MVELSRYVLIDSTENIVTWCFMWDGESLLPPMNGRIEKYDPAIHPPLGLRIPVGSGWEDRQAIPPKEVPVIPKKGEPGYLEYRDAERAARLAKIRADFERLNNGLPDGDKS